MSLTGQMTCPSMLIVLLLLFSNVLAEGPTNSCPSMRYYEYSDVYPDYDITQRLKPFIEEHEQYGNASYYHYIYEVKPPAQIVGVKVIRTYTGQVLMDCNPEHSTQSNPCCSNDMIAEPSNLENCNVSYRVMSRKADGHWLVKIQFDLTFGPLPDGVVHVFLETPTGQFRYSDRLQYQKTHSVCPEISSRFHSANSQLLVQHLRHRETHRLDFVNFQKSLVYVKDYEQIRLQSRIASDGNSTVAVLLYKRSMGNNNLEVTMFLPDGLPIPIKENETTFNGFSEVVQLDRLVNATQVFDYRFNIKFPLQTEAFLLVAAANNPNLTAHFNPYVESYLNGVFREYEPTKMTELGMPVAPAIRLIRIQMVRDIFARSGTDFQISLWAGQRYCQGEYTCEVQPLDSSEPFKPTSDMTCQWDGKRTYFVIRNIAKRHTGIYRCAADCADRWCVFNHPVIVLPDESDLTISLTHAPYEWADTVLTPWAQKDWKGELFVVTGQQLYATCRYNFAHLHMESSVLSLKHVVGGSNQTLPFSIVQTWSRQEGSLNVTYRAFQIGAHATPGQVTDQRLACLYRYKGNRAKRKYDPRNKQQDRETLSTFKSLFTSTRLKPKLLLSTLSTSDDQLTRLMRNQASLFKNELPFTMPAHTIVDEGMIIKGTFIALHYKQSGWGSVWIARRTHKDSLTRTTCQVRQYPVDLSRQVKAIAATEDLSQTETLASTKVEFKCVLSAATSYVIISVFNGHRTEAELRNNEALCADNLVGVLQSLDPESSNITAQTVVVDPSDVVSTHHVVKYSVRWNGTLLFGSRAHMLWISDPALKHAVHCAHAPFGSTPNETLPTGFQLVGPDRHGIYTLSKDSVDLRDGGLYACFYQPCAQCDRVLLGPMKRLVVLPSPEHLSIKLNHEPLAYQPSFTYPTLITNQTMTIDCVTHTLPAYLAKNTMTMLHEAYYKPNNTFIPVQSEMISDRTEPSFTVKTYRTWAVEPQLNWNHSRMTCRLEFAQVARDQFDFMTEATVPQLTQQLRIDVEDRMPPRFLHKLTTGHAQLSAHLKQSHPGNVSKALWDIDSRPITIAEGEVSLKTVAFLGFPRGVVETYVVYMEKGSVQLEECLVKVEEMQLVVSDDEVENMLQVTRGRNIAYIRSKCFLMLDHVGIASAVLMSKAVANESRRFKEFVRKSFQMTVDSMFDAKLASSLMKRDVDTYQVVRVDVKWKSVVSEGASVLMGGRLRPGAIRNLHCTRTLQRSELKQPIDGNQWSIRYVMRGHGFFLYSKSVTYDHSGLYECREKFKSKNYSTSIGFAKRSLFVLPNPSMFSIRVSINAITPNNESILRPFTQHHPDGTPFLLASQTASVRCIHRLSEYWRLFPSVKLDYQIYRISEKKFVPLEPKPEDDFKFHIGNVPNHVTSFKIEAPDSNPDYKDIKLTCLFSFDRMGHGERDVDDTMEALKMVASLSILYEPRSEPYIFDSYLSSDRPKLLENYAYTQGKMALNSVDFHRSASTNRLPEGIIRLHVPSYSGFPQADLVVWTFFEYNQLLVEQCRLESSTVLTSALMPTKMKQHRSVDITGEKGYTNKTFLCNLRPEHVAVVILAYATTEDQMLLMKSVLLQHATAMVTYWLRYPTRTDKLSLSFPETALDYRAFRVQIGWFATRVRDTVFSLPTEHLDSTTDVHYQCYYVGHVDGTMTEPVLILDQRMNALSPLHVRPSLEPRHSGMYTCNYTVCTDSCTSHVLFVPRRLTVLPSSKDVGLYISPEPLTRLSKPSVKRIKQGQSVYAYCVYENGIIGRSQISPVRLDVTVWKNREKFVKIRGEKRVQYYNPDLHAFVLEHRFAGPKREQIYDDPLIECSVSFEGGLVDEKDLGHIKTIAPISISETVEFDSQVTPIIYGEATESDVKPIQDAFRRTPTDATRRSQMFRYAAHVSETFVTVTVYAALGIPRGTLIGAGVDNAETQETYEYCQTRKTEDLNYTSVPGVVRMSHSEAFIKNANLARTTFVCLVRSSLRGLAFVASSKLVPSRVLMHEHIMVTLSSYMYIWSSGVPEMDIPPTCFEDFLCTYHVIFTFVPRSVTVRLGYGVVMLGHTFMKSLTSVNCSFTPPGSSAVFSPFDRGFQLLYGDYSVGFKLAKRFTERNDSGTYRCQVKGSNSWRLHRIIGVIDEPEDERYTPQMIITRYPIRSGQKWKEDYPFRSEEGSYIMDNNIDRLFVHCIYPKDYSTTYWDVTSYLTSKGLTSSSFDIRSFYKLTGKFDAGVRVAVSYQFRVPPSDSYTDQLEATCEAFQRSHNAYSVLKWRTLRKTIDILYFIKPKIYHRSAISADPGLQQAIREQPYYLPSSLEFHSVQLNDSVVEDLTDLIVPIFLGNPRGEAHAVLFSLSGKYLEEEECKLVSMKGLTMQNLSQEIEFDLANMTEYEFNFINATFRCLLRSDHVSIVLSVYNAYNRDAVRESIRREVQKFTTHLVQNPNDTKHENLTIPHGSSVVVRAAKLEVYYRATLKIGDRISLPGYMHKAPNADSNEIVRHIRCRKHTDPRSPGEPVGVDFLVVPHGQSQVYYLTKPRAEFRDSGFYSCNVSEESCPHCPPNIGFKPRQIYVAPDESIINLVINPKLLKANQNLSLEIATCDSSGHPCIIPGESIFSYCEYPTPKSHVTKPRYSFNVYLSIGRSKSPYTHRKVEELTWSIDWATMYRGVYHITAPDSPRSKSFLSAECTLNYERSPLIEHDANKILGPQKVTKTLWMSLVEGKPVKMRNGSVVSSSLAITHGMENQTENSVFDAISYYNATLSKHLLEGLITLMYSVDLGSPRGVSAVMMFYEFRGRVLSEPCLLAHSPSKDSSAKGKSFERHSWNCALRSIHFALVMITATTFVQGESPNLVVSLVREELLVGTGRWRQNENNSAIDVHRLKAGRSIIYKVLPLIAGWRATLFEGEPIIFFGSLRKNDAGKVTCFYEKNGKNHSIPISGSETAFIVVKRPSRGVYEVIKTAAEMSDSATYYCYSGQCHDCDSPRKLLVLPPKQKIAFVSNNWLFDEGQFPVEELTKFDSSGAQYAARGQYVYCIHSATGSDAIHINFDTTCVFFSNTSGVRDKCYLERDVERLIPDWPSQHTFLASHMVVSKEAADAYIFNVSCVYTIDSAKDDVMHAKSYVISRLMRIVSTLFAEIDVGSIQTSHDELTELFQKPESSRVTSRSIRALINRKLVPEGILVINYTILSPIPAVFTGVSSVYRSGTKYYVRTCSLYSIRQNLTGSDEPESEELMVRCLITPQHVALLLYAFQSETGVAPSRHMSAAIQQLLLRSQTDGPLYTLKSPPNTYGQYRFIRIKVGWFATAKRGETVRMYGGLGKMDREIPMCYFGYKIADTPIQEDSGRLVKLENKTENYIALTIYNVQHSDSGIYRCEPDQCTDACALDVGFVSRQLLVLPDTKLRVAPSANATFLEETCESPELLTLTQSKVYTVSCVCTIPVEYVKSYTVSIMRSMNGTERPKRLPYRIRSEVVNTSMGLKQVEYVSQVDTGFVTGTGIDIVLTCDVEFDLPRIEHDLRTETTHVVSDRVRLVDQNDLEPRVFSSSISSNSKTIRDALRSKSYFNEQHDGSPRRKISFAKRDLPEGPVNLRYEVDLVEPTGWTFVWSVFNNSGDFYLEKCPMQVIGGANHRRRKVQTTCLLRAETAALMLGAIRVIRGELDRNAFEQNLEFALLDSVSESRIFRLQEVFEDLNVTCFQFLNHFVLLETGWRQYRPLRKETSMIGRLGGVSPNDIACYHNGRRLTHGNSTLVVNTAQGFFNMTLPKLTLDHVGNYSCRHVNSSVDTVQVGFPNRQLIVLPDDSMAVCSISAIRRNRVPGVPGVARVAFWSSRVTTAAPPATTTTANENKTMVFRAGERVQVTCSFARLLSGGHQPEYRLLHHIINKHNQTMKEFRGQTELNSTKESFLHTELKYIHKTVSAEEYSGPVQLTCLGRLRWKGEFTTEKQVTCTVLYDILEPADGELTFETLSSRYKSQPVPLGSEFKCTGGHGVPRLKYTWTAIPSALYADPVGGEDYASLLPGHGGGYGGPKQVFVDQPKKEPIIDGDTLRVPNDPAFRGMSYLYKCTGSNRVNGTLYTIEKVLYFTVMICPTYETRLELQVLLNYNLFSACTLTGEKLFGLQYYGHFYLALVRQLILGLPLGEDYVSYIFYDPTTKPHRVPKEKTREDLVRTLYSRTVKPFTAKSGCHGKAPSLKDMLHAPNIANLRPEGQRARIALFTFDSRIDLNLPEDKKTDWQRNKDRGLKLILGIAHPADEHGNTLAKNLSKLLLADKIVHLVPGMPGPVRCDNCEYPAAKPELRIDRGSLFTELCALANSYPPPPGPAPQIRFIVPNEYWYDGAPLGASCSPGPLNQSRPEWRYTGLTLCLTSASRLEAMVDPKSPKLSSLRGACEKILGERAIGIHQAGSYEGVSGSWILNVTSTLDKVLCIQRQGDELPEVGDRS